MKFFRFVLLSFTFGIKGFLFSQTIHIYGKITDTANRAISDVSIFLLDIHGETLDYTLSNASGHFLLKPKKIEKQYILIAQKYGLQTIRDTLTKPFRLPLNIQLQPLQEKLNEIVIHVSPIKQKGDTIIYNAQAYNGEENKVVSDLLARMPGFTIDENGRIFFQGEPIKKVMVEGLDMTNGDYTKITERLDAHAIKRVELYQKYQEKKILKNIRPSNDVALNLILKEKIYSVTHLETAGEMREITKLLSVNPMFFGKQKQWNLFGTWNQIFLTNRYVYPTLNMHDMHPDFYPVGFSQKWILVNPPDFPDQKKNFNPFFNARLYATDMSFLRLTRRKNQWKIGGEYFKSDYTRKTEEKKLIYDPAGNYGIIKQSKYRSTIQPQDFYVRYTVNKQKTYFTSGFTYQNMNEFNRMTSLTNGRSQSGQLATRTTHIHLATNWIKRTNQWLWEVWQKISYHTTNQDFTVRPFGFDVPPVERQDEMTQQITSGIVAAQQYVKANLLLRNHVIIPEWGAGYEFLNFGFQSNILKNNLKVKNKNWKNRYEVDYHHFISRLAWYAKKNSWFVEAEIPIHFHHILQKDRIRDTTGRKNFLAFNPSIKFIKKLNNIELSYKTSWQNKPEPFPNMFPGKVFSDIYTANFSKMYVQLHKQWSNILKADYTDAVHGFFLYLKLLYARSTENTTPSYTLSSSGFVFRTLADKKSFLDNRMVEIGGDKQFFSFPMQFSFRISFNQMQSTGKIGRNFFISINKIYLIR